MARLSIAIPLLVAAVAFAGAAPAPSFALAESSSPTAADQGSWAQRKKQLRLPNGLTIAYVELGDPKGKPLLLLHGYTDSSRSWSLMAPHLSRYRLLIPDQRGHGASDKPACCYSPTVLADDARLFLDALGVRRAAIVGHSLGSMVAMAMAADLPERVSAVVLVGSTALAPVKKGDWLYDSAMALKAPLDPQSPFLKEWHPSNQPTRIDPVFAAAVEQDYLAIPIHVWRGVLRELIDLPVGRHAADVKAPVLILSGGKDPIFGPEHHASLVKAFPRAEAHVVAGLGHNLIWEKPADLAALVDRFLTRSTAPTGPGQARNLDC